MITSKPNRRSFIIPFALAMALVCLFAVPVHADIFEDFVPCEDSGDCGNQAGDTPDEEVGQIGSDVPDNFGSDEDPVLIDDIDTGGDGGSGAGEDPREDYVPVGGTTDAFCGIDQPILGGTPIPVDDAFQVPHNCKELVCIGDESFNRPKDDDISNEDNRCNSCDKGSITADPGKDNTVCGGDGTDAQECFTCQSGKCAIPVCQAPSLTSTVKLASSKFKVFGSEAVAKIGNFPYLKLSNTELTASAERKTGKECCGVCDKPLQPVPYSEETGKLEVKTDVVAIVPGTGLLLPPIEQEFLAGKIKLSAEFEFGLGGRGEFSMSGQGTEKVSDCIFDKCHSASFGGAGEVKVGVIGKIEVMVVSCNLSKKEDCADIVGVTGDASSTFNIGMTALTKWYSENCTLNTCSNFRINPIEFEAQASFEIKISRFVSVDWKVDEKVELHGGLNNNGCK